MELFSAANILPKLRDDLIVSARRTETAILTNFQTFLHFVRKKKSLELSNIFFETSSQKGMLWRNKKNFDFSSLISDSRNILTTSLKQLQNNHT